MTLESAKPDFEVW